MAENVVINFEANTAGLETTINLLEKLGQIDKKTADEFRAANKVVADQQAAFNAAGKAADDLGNKTTGAGKKISGANKEAANSFGDLQSALGSIGEKIIAAFAVERIIAFAEKTVEASNAAQLATSRLDFAVTKIIGGTKEQVQELIKQSEDLSKVTYFSPRQIQEAQTLATQFGLTTDETKRLTAIIPDLAIALKTDLAGATDTALRAIEGQSKGLKVIGADFKDTGSKVENFNTLLQNTAKFTGVATDALNTNSGAVLNNEKNLEILEEQIGAKIAPALIRLKTLALESAAGLATLLNPDSATATVLDQINHIGDALENRIANISNSVLQQRSKALQDEFVTLQKQQQDLLERSRNEPDLQGSERLSQQALDLGKQIDIVLGKEKAINTELQKRKDFNDNIGKQSELDIARAENLLSLTKQQLQAEIDGLRARPDSATTDVRDEIDRRQKQIDAIADAEKKAAEKALAARIAASQKLKEQALKDSQDALAAEQTDAVAKLQQEEKNAEDNARLVFEASQKTKADAQNLADDLLSIQQVFAAKILKQKEEDAKKLKELNDKNGKEDLADTLSVQDLLAQKQKDALTQAYIDRGDFSKGAQEKLNQDLLATDLEFERVKNDEIQKSDSASAKEKLDSAKKLAEDELKIKKDEADKEAEIAKKRAEILKQIEDEALSGLFDIYKAETDNLITELDNQKQAQSDYYDDLISKNKDAFDKRAVTAKQFRATEEQLQQQKINSEKSAQAQLNSLKQKEDAANKLQKVFEIIISTARNVVEFPLLAPYYLTLGAIEEALVLGTPAPKYKRGTLRVPGINTGQDSVLAMLQPEEAVIPSQTNKDYHESVKAIYNRSIPASAMNDFVTNYRMKSLKGKSDTIISVDIDYDKLAEKIGNSVAWKTRKGDGVYIKNTDELASAMVTKTDWARKR